MGSRFHFLLSVPLEIQYGAEKGYKAGNGCPCAKGSHFAIFLPENIPILLERKDGKGGRHGF